MNPERITQLALAALVAADAVKIAKREFADAVFACVDYHNSDENYTQWKFRRFSGRDPYSGEWKTGWIDQDGNDASNAPEVIRNREAWQKLREAKRAAGAAKGSLTKALRKIIGKLEYIK